MAIPDVGKKFDCGQQNHTQGHGHAEADSERFQKRSVLRRESSLPLHNVVVTGQWHKLPPSRASAKIVIRSSQVLLILNFAGKSTAAILHFQIRTERT